MTTVCEIYRAETLPLSDPGLFGACLDRLPEIRRRKALTPRHEESRRLSLGAGLLLVLALEERGIDGRSAGIAEGPYGKPYLPEHPEIHFSLSHSGTRVLCAVAGVPVGCDVERVGRGSEKLAVRFFHPEEREALNAEKDPEAWQRLFARIWTRKESRVKADGTGISAPFSGFSALGDGGGYFYEDFFEDSPSGPVYSYSCCLPERPGSVLWRRVDLKEAFGPPER